MLGSPEAVLVLEHGAVVDANTLAHELLGADPGALVGESITAIFKEDLLKLIKEAGAGSGPEIITVHGAYLADQVLDVRVGTLHVPGHNFVVLSARDVTTRVGDMDSLEGKEKRFNEAQKVAHIGSWAWDIPANQVTWTDELYRLYGLEPQSEYIDYQRYLELIHPDDRERADAVVQEAFQSQAEFDFEHRLLLPDGHVRWLRGRGELFVDDEGAPSRMVGTAQDITDQKVAQLAAANALHEKEILLKEVHHRVKNNLQIVTSLLRIQGRKTTDPMAQDVLAQSRSRIRSMALVHEKLYRSEDLTQLDASDYLGDLVAALRRTVSAPAGIEVSVEVEPFKVDLDRAITVGLITNELVANAFKHAFPEGHGHVWVRARVQDDGALMLEVEDDGMGLEPDFDPKQSESLGMQLVLTLVSQLGASLSWGGEADSETPMSGGARFVVRVDAL